MVACFFHSWYIRLNLKKQLLPWQVECFQYKWRLHVIASHFHWNVNTNDCSFHGTGYFRLMQTHSQCYFNHRILSDLAL